jgi:hypothetical protein
MKSRTAFSCSPEVRQEWRGKAGHVPATKRTVVKTEKFHENIDYHEKKSKRHGCHANAALHNLHNFPILAVVEDQQGA